MHCGRNVEETCIHEHDDNIIITTTTLRWKKTSVLADLTCEGEMGCDQVTHSSANNPTPITIFLQWKYLKYFSFGECCRTNEEDDGDVDEGNIMDAPKSHVINNKYNRKAQEPFCIVPGLWNSIRSLLHLFFLLSMFAFKSQV